jgi:D-ala D-ala ligase N-terminal domain protein
MKNIAVLMGGYSRESEVSLKSAATVVEHLDKSKYASYPILITKEKWVYVDSQNQEFVVDKNDFSLTLKGKKITFDCAFNAIHGTPGEDGYLQAYFALVGVPITGCSMYASALTFNKRDMLSVLSPYGIPRAKAYYLNQGEHFSVREIIKTVGLPCFVKANRSGSSFGVYKAYNEKDIDEAIEKAFEVDNEIIIEEFLKGTEVSVGVITYRGKKKVLPITEIVSENDFFDYQAKYQGRSKEITPARLTAQEKEKVEALALKVYDLLQMKGFSRSEYILVGGEPYLLEMNTTPGLSNASILPQQAKAAGITLANLFDNAIEEVMETHEE